MSQKKPLITFEDFEEQFAHCCRKRNKNDNWPSKTYLIYNCTICKDEELITEQTWSLEKNKFEKHAEILMLNRIKDLKKKTSTAFNRVVLFVYLSYSPCSNCAEEIIKFKRDQERLGQKTDIKLKFSNFYKIYKEVNKNGLVKLFQEDVDLDIFDKDSDWETFFDEIGVPDTTEKNDHLEEYESGVPDTIQEDDLSEASSSAACTSVTPCCWYKDKDASGKVGDLQLAIEDLSLKETRVTAPPPAHEAIAPPPDPDAGIDDAVIANHGFLPVSDVLQQDVEQWDEAAEAANEVIKKLSTEKAALANNKEHTDAISIEMKSLQVYRDRLRDAIKNRETKGYGGGVQQQQKRHSNKVSQPGDIIDWRPKSGEEVGAVGGQTTEREKWLKFARRDDRRKREADDRQELNKIKQKARQ